MTNENEPAGPSGKTPRPGTSGTLPSGPSAPRGETGPNVGVGVAVVEDGKLLLVQRGREPGRGLWAVPGGKVRRGEPIRVAARREVREETGLEVEVGATVWVGEYIEGEHHIVLIDFAGSVVGGQLKAGDDADDARWVRLDEVSKLPLTSTMYDLVDTLRS